MSEQGAFQALSGEYRELESASKDYTRTGVLRGMDVVDRRLISRGSATFQVWNVERAKVVTELETVGYSSSQFTLAIA